MWYTQEFGYRVGTKITEDLSGGLLQKVTKGASILGMFVLGALIERWVSINFTPVVSTVQLSDGAYIDWSSLPSGAEGIQTALQQYASGLSLTPEKVTTLQDNLNSLIPGFVPLLLTLLCMWLLKKNVSPIVIIIALIWRWTGYNMVFYLAGLQNIEYSVYEAAKIDGANGWKTFWGITVPLLKPTIIMTFIMSINGTLQLFDESVNLTNGGPANATITMSHYIYNNSLGQGVANFGYATAMSFFVFIIVAVLAFINMKVGDTRD